MVSNYGANQYKQTAIKTANRGQLLLMLYEEAIRNVKKASLAIDKKDLVLKGKAIGKTHDIINELLNTLDHEIGGKIAEELERLYNFIIEKLVKANVENSKEHLLASQKILETLYSGWKEAVASVTNEGGVPKVDGPKT